MEVFFLKKNSYTIESFSQDVYFKEKLYFFRRENFFFQEALRYSEISCLREFKMAVPRQPIQNFGAKSLKGGPPFSLVYFDFESR